MNKYYCSHWLAQWDVPLGESAELQSPIRAAPGSIPMVRYSHISFPDGLVCPVGYSHAVVREPWRVTGRERKKNPQYMRNCNDEVLCIIINTTNVVVEYRA